MKRNPGSIPLQGGIEFISSASGKDRQRKTLRQRLEQAGPGQPLFIPDQTIARFAQKNLVEVIDYIGIFDLLAQIGDQAVGQKPVVVPSARIFKILDRVVRHQRASEMPDRLADSLAVGFGHLYQHAIHIKNNYVGWRLLHYQICSNSSKKRRIWSRVPTVTRTHPGSS